MNEEKTFCVWFDFKANYLILAKNNNKSKISCQIKSLHAPGLAYPR